MTPAPSDADAQLAEVLRAFGVRPTALLGSGGEAEVYALGADRVLRVHRGHTRDGAVPWRTRMLAEIAQGAARVPFAVPEVLETDRVAGRWISIERRLAGRTMSEVLGEARGSARASLIRNYLAAADAIGDLPIERPGDRFGDIGPFDRIGSKTFRAYLARRAARNLAAAGPDYAAIDPAALASPFPEPQNASFVHLDAFAGNMLADGSEILAVIDFGPTVLIGDRRLDPLTAAVYLEPSFVPSANESDRAVAAGWLEERGWTELFAPARWWVAAYWSAATTDLRLARWCRSVLLG